MDALINLKDHCPDWARRLDELSGQIEQRQLDLAAFAAQQQQQHSGRSPNGRAGSKKSLRNRGSTESLRPNDEGEVPSTGTDTPGRTSPVHNKNAAHEARRTSVGSKGGVDKPHKSSSNGNGNGNGIANGNGNGLNSSHTASERQANEVVAVASARARANLRRTQLSRRRAAVAAESLLSADGATPSRYRSRNLVVVYYDSYVQSFFEELVKFVSASRNLMRKARMAARVAQIKRMAELEVPDDDNDDPDPLAAEPRLVVEGPARTVPLQPAPVALRPDTSNHGLGNTNGGGKEDGAVEKTKTKASSSDEKRDGHNGNGVPPAPNLTGQPYTRTSLFGNGNGNGNNNKPSSPTPRPTRPGMAGGYTSFSSLSFGFGGSHQPDIFDELDKVLEFVQSMCEHAAHQFLRDGDCADEIIKIKDRLNETRETADKEMERMLQQDRTHNNGALPKAKVEVEAVQSRSLRPQITRRDTLGSSIPTGEAEEPAAEKLEKQLADPDGPLEVDDGAGDDPPRFRSKSSTTTGPRRMGP